jgi:hypothetical protein
MSISVMQELDAIATPHPKKVLNIAVEMMPWEFTLICSLVTYPHLKSTQPRSTTGSAT